jgi:KDO2-lipid IV(A) lauroyltransferase
MHRLEYAAVRLFGALFRLFPPEVASATMGAVLGTVMPFTSRHRRALEHLALALPDKTEAERKRIARAMWWHFGRVFGEAFVIDRLVADRSRVAFPPDFERFREVGREGAISAALHLGNWEIAGILPREAGLPLAGVYQALHNPLADRHLRRMRAAAFPAGLYPKGPDLGRTLIRLARSGIAVGIVSDLREKRGIGVTFFGEPAYATPLPALLARTARRPIIAGAVIRTKGVRFRALMEVIDVPVTDDRDHDVAVATQALHDVFERWIRLAPEQWLWTHRKWARSAARPLVVGARRRDRHPSASASRETMNASGRTSTP